MVALERKVLFGFEGRGKGLCGGRGDLLGCGLLRSGGIRSHGRLHGSGSRSSGRPRITGSLRRHLARDVALDAGATEVGIPTVLIFA